MRFDKACKSILNPVEEQVDEVLDAVAEDMLRFVRAGGKIDLNSWTELNEFTKDCLIGARYEWRVEFVYMVAKAVREKYGPEQIWSMLDGGEVLKDRVADDVADAAALNAAREVERQRNEPVPSRPADAVQAEANPVAGNK